MTFPLPEWVPAEAGVAPALSEPAGPTGRVVVVLAGAEALSEGWVGSVTVSLADAWSGAGARLVLTDACLHEPQLHQTLGLPLGEGLVDALRWGASVKRVALRPEGRGFFVITAGTAVVDGAAVLDHPRWPALCAGFREAGVTLVVLTPALDPGAASVLAQATEVVVLATPGEDAAALAAAWEGPVLGVLGLGSPGPDETAAADGAVAERFAAPSPGGPDGEATPWGFDAPLVPDEEAEPLSGDAIAFLDDAPVGDAVAPDQGSPPFDGDDPAWAFEVLDDAARGAGEGDAFRVPAWDEGDAGAFAAEAEFEPDPEADPRDEDPAEAFFPTGGAGAGDAPEGEALAREPVPTFEEIVEESGEALLRPAASANRTRTLLLVLLVVVVGVLAAAWLGYVQIPGITPSGAGAAVAPGGPVATIAASPPTATGERQPYSVALGAFQDAATAQALVEELTRKVEGVLFVAAPVSASGAVLHRVLAGPAADSAGAASLLARVAQGSGLDASGWAPRATPKAFQLGEMPELDAARRRAQVLQGLGIPAYVFSVPFSDGSVRFRVYAGAYTDEADASHLSTLLQERGLNSASLSDRIGRLPE